MRFRTDLKSPD